MTATSLKDPISASASNDLAGRTTRAYRSGALAQASSTVATHRALKRTAYLLQKSNNVIRLTSSVTSPLVR